MTLIIVIAVHMNQVFTVDSFNHKDHNAHLSENQLLVVTINANHALACHQITPSVHHVLQSVTMAINLFN